jgi:hypothetical protein
MRRIDREPVPLPVLGGGLEALWDTLASIAAELEGVPWTIVGGQMVLLHALEHGVIPHRLSTDIDAAVDVRADPEGIKKLVGALIGLGFQLAGESPEGFGYRFAMPTVASERGVAQGELVVDVLAPEGLGANTDLRTVGNAKAFPAGGVSQALKRTSLVPFGNSGEVVCLPRPDLLGAMVVKAVAAQADKVDPERHLLDLVFLCDLVEDPIELAGAATGKDRKRLQVCLGRLPRDHPAWNVAREPTDARAALRILSDS